MKLFITLLVITVASVVHILNMASRGDFNDIAAIGYGFGMAMLGAATVLRYDYMKRVRYEQKKRS